AAGGDEPLSLHLKYELLARESERGVACALVRVYWLLGGDELTRRPVAPPRHVRSRNLGEFSGSGRSCDSRGTGRTCGSRLNSELVEHSAGWRPVHWLPLKMHRLLAIGVMNQVSESAAIDVRTIATRAEEQVDGIDAIVMLDELPNGQVSQAL